MLQFEIDLYRQEKMPILLVAATLVMANKQIDTATFNELWEEIKMLDVLKFAHEKGMEEGKKEGKKEGKIEGKKEGKKEGKIEGRKEGRKEGRLESTREMVLKFLEESVGVVPAYIYDEVMSVSRPDILVRLVKQAMICKKIEDFEKMLKLANRKPQA
ncbi:MAG: hypothetical protein GY749_11765 [Desulfobacteraceae bacterium]|nr:hypothetical protein [Desulfobacteraceae bacterium]